MITFAKIMLWLAEFDLALARMSGNQQWLYEARVDCYYWRGEVDRLSIQEQRTC